MTVVWVPQDRSARAMGADEVAAALAGIEGVQVRRNGTRGMLWREPLVEVETDRGRVGYSNVEAGNVEALVAAGLLDGADLGQAAAEAGVEQLGLVEEDPWLTGQERVSAARIGRHEPTDLVGYEQDGGWAGLRRALELDGEAVIEEVIASGLRGRGGAGFPTGIKWRTVLQAPAEQKFIACNLDEGDSGTFADRILAEADPFTLVEGMAIAGLAVGATEGYIYCRSEYPDVIAILKDAIALAGEHGYLGDDVLGSGRAFRLWVRTGAGAYICGEETSMLESIEGRRGEVRAKPPIPALVGLWGAPTIVNNMLTFAAVPMILADGGAAYAAHGTGRSRGTQLFQLAGNIARGGLVELPFGVPLRELVEDWGGGTLSGGPVRAVQLGGPLGAYLPADRLDVAMDYEEVAEAGGMLGHGGIVVFDDTFDAARMARFAMEFCSIESCGKCTPCRIGSTRGVETIDRLCGAQDPAERTVHLATLEDLCETMTKGSLCAMGGLTPMPVRSALAHFPEDFERSPR